MGSMILIISIVMYQERQKSIVDSGEHAMEPCQERMRCYYSIIGITSIIFYLYPWIVCDNLSGNNGIRKQWIE